MYKLLNKYLYASGSCTLLHDTLKSAGEGMYCINSIKKTNSVYVINPDNNVFLACVAPYTSVMTSNKIKYVPVNKIEIGMLPNIGIKTIFLINKLGNINRKE